MRGSEAALSSPHWIKELDSSSDCAAVHSTSQWLHVYFALQLWAESEPVLKADGDEEFCDDLQENETNFFPISVPKQQKQKCIKFVFKYRGILRGISLGLSGGSVCVLISQVLTAGAEMKCESEHDGCSY